MLLLAKVNSISKEKSHKKDVFGASGIDCIKIIFTLPTKIITFYI